MSVLLQRPAGAPGDGGELLEALRRAMDRFGGIRCPKCGWRPTKDSRWACERSCRHLWNTFETRGRCPRCGRQWLQTCCLSCHQWSEHEAWYEERQAG